MKPQHYIVTDKRMPDMQLIHMHLELYVYKACEEYLVMRKLEGKHVDTMYVNKKVARRAKQIRAHWTGVQSKTAQW